METPSVRFASLRGRDLTVANEVYKRAARASSAGLVSTAVITLTQVAVVPVVLSHWGPETYGVWLALIAGFMMVRTVDAGYTGYVGNQFNVLYHTAPVELRRTLSAALMICVALAVLELFLVVSAVVIDALPVLLGVGKTASGTGDLEPALVVLTLAWVLTGIFPSIIHRLLIPAGLLTNSIWWALAFQSAQVAVLLVGAVVGATIFWTAVAYAVVQSTIYLGSAIYIRKKLPAFYPWWGHGRLATGLHDLWRSTSLSVITFVQQTGTNGIVLLIAGVLGSVIVPIFTTVRTLANLWTTVGNVLVSAFSPEIVRYYAIGHHEKLVASLRVIALLLGVAVNVTLLLCMPLVASIYSIWTKDALAFDFALFLYLAVGVSLMNAGLVFTSLLASINSLRASLTLTCCRTGIGFVVGFALAGEFGLSGIGFGLCVGEGVASILAAFVLVPNVIGARNGYLSRSDVAEGFLFCIPVIFVAGFGVTSGEVHPWLVLVAITAIIIAGWRNWNRLPFDVRRGLLRTVTFQR